MGSKSDWDTMQPGRRDADAIRRAARMPRRVGASHAGLDGRVRDRPPPSRGLEVIIAGAGGAAHLPGMVAAHTVLPVIGVPVQSAALNGLDSLLSIVQMPKGVPVATVAIGAAGAANAGLLAVAILATSRPELRAKLRAVPRRDGRRGPAQTRCRDRRVITPGSTIGVLGGGQLGRMFAMAARRLGYRVHTLAPEHDTPTGQIADVEINASVRRPRRRPRVRAGRRRRHVRVRERAGGGGGGGRGARDRPAERPRAARSRSTAFARRRSSPITACRSTPFAPVRTDDDLRAGAAARSAVRPC